MKAIPGYSQNSENRRKAAGLEPPAGSCFLAPAIASLETD